ncbi:hypothetical protein KFK09_015032 [Dendrobium nobile]|uniref:Uncharacterized protein n=1 Tax=Dendrobium nobile TaxID=94219 RepID=A0A8T3B513_DENNO|nr:hypothetical protein KFK09_015032 [Dendrobium nobile]
MDHNSPAKLLDCGGREGVSCERPAEQAEPYPQRPSIRSSRAGLRREERSLRLPVCTVSLLLALTGMGEACSSGALRYQSGRTNALYAVLGSSRFGKQQVR